MESSYVKKPFLLCNFVVVLSSAESFEGYLRNPGSVPLPTEFLEMHYNPDLSE